MKRKLLAALLAALLLLSACQYIVVEDQEEREVNLGGPARAEAEEPPPEPEEPPLRRGSRDGEGEARVTALQQRLAELGYLTGRADGIFGAATEAALQTFQLMNGLEETGELDAATGGALASFRALPKPTPTPTPLARGAKGEDVKTVQEKLKEYGFLSGKADGDFGADTEKAYKEFQQYLRDVAPTPSPTPSPSPVPVAGMSSPMPGPEAEGEPEETAPEETEPPFEPDGVVSEEELSALAGDLFQRFREDLARGSRGREVSRLQNRLSDLDYQWDKVDGQFGSNTEDALKYFQKLNGLEESGKADEATQLKLFSTVAVKSDRPKQMYLLKVSVADQRVYAYRWVNGEYSKLERTMVCSTGTKKHPTPLGTYKADGPAGRWYYFKKYNCWAQYAYRISGPYLFHSVIYSRKDASSLQGGSVSRLGSRASHGCVRLSVEDVKWIYNNCPSGTTVTIY